VVNSQWSINKKTQGKEATEIYMLLADTAELRRFLIKKHRAKKQQRFSLLAINYLPSAYSGDR